MWFKMHPWVLPGMIGGIHLLLAGLISPIKWLALLFLFDFTIWMFLYAVVKEGAFKEDRSGESEKSGESDRK